MIRQVIKYTLIALLLSISFSLLDIITIRYQCDYLGDMGPGFYGFPFIYRTTIPWVNSMSGVFYVSGFLGNLFVFFGFILVILLILKRIILHRIVKRIFKVVGYVITLILIVLATLNFMITDWRFEWKDMYFENYGGKPLECEKQFEIFYIGKD